MTRNTVYIFIFVCFAISVGWLADEVGNIGIRRVSSSHGLELQVASPIVPGLATVVHWTLLPTSTFNQPIEIYLRTADQEYLIGQGHSSDLAKKVTVPCEIEAELASVVLVSSGDGEMIAWNEVEVLPVGQDCALRRNNRTL